MQKISEVLLGPSAAITNESLTHGREAEASLDIVRA